MQTLTFPIKNRLSNSCLIGCLIVVLYLSYSCLIIAFIKSWKFDCGFTETISRPKSIKPARPASDCLTVDGQKNQASRKVQCCLRKPQSTTPTFRPKFNVDEHLPISEISHLACRLRIRATQIFGVWVGRPETNPETNFNIDLSTLTFRIWGLCANEIFEPQLYLCPTLFANNFVCAPLQFESNCLRPTFCYLYYAQHCTMFEQLV